MTNKIASPLSRKAVLASLNISRWRGRKLDRRVTDEVNRRHHAAKDAGRYNKQLIDPARLEEINSLVSAARHLHYTMTLPWADEGPRILPNVLFDKFSNEFRDIKRKFDATAAAFCKDYPNYIAERKRQLNGMFNASDYPSITEIRTKFRFDLMIMPFPNAADFRSDLDDDTVNDIRQEIVETTDRVVGDAMKHTAQQIVETVGHMAEKLKEYKVKEDSFFRDSLVDNVRDLAKLLPAFNLTDDKRLSEIIKRIDKELCTEDAAALRDNDKVRADVRKSADQIVSEVKKFFG